MIGRDYWPSVEDEQRLPYIRAIIKEVRCLVTESASEFESRQFRLAFLSLLFAVGATGPLAVLAGYAALLDRGLCVQRDVHTEEHGRHP